MIAADSQTLLIGGEADTGEKYTEGWEVDPSNSRGPG